MRWSAGVLEFRRMITKTRYGWIKGNRHKLLTRFLWGIETPGWKWDQPTRQRNSRNWVCLSFHEDGGRGATASSSRTTTSWLRIELIVHRYSIAEVTRYISCNIISHYSIRAPVHNCHIWIIHYCIQSINQIVLNASQKLNHPDLAACCTLSTQKSDFNCN